MRNSLLLPLLAILAACNQQQAGETANNQAAAPTDVDVLPPDESVATPTRELATGVANASPNDLADSNPATAIPAALHGRWGLVPADCTSTGGDAKGLVMISADSIRFYESLAKPAQVRTRTDSSIQGEFAFTGEGQEWTTTMSWASAGDKLTRIDSEADSKLVYTRCAR